MKAFTITLLTKTIPILPMNLEFQTFLEKARSCLVKRGLRLTRNREHVLEGLGLSGKAWSLKDLHEFLSTRYACDQSSVFRALEDLRTWGWVERFQLPGEKGRVYALRPEAVQDNFSQNYSASLRPSLEHSPHQHASEEGEPYGVQSPSLHSHSEHLDPDHSIDHNHHHHHVQCVDCGRIGHLDECMPSSYLNLLERQSGFRLIEHRLEFTGRCEDCRSSPASDQSPELPTKLGTASPE
jgi:Fe2+ or Zn2+ uptake regulation protein